MEYNDAVNQLGCWKMWPDRNGGPEGVTESRLAHCLYLLISLVKPRTWLRPVHSTEPLRDYDSYVHMSAEVSVIFCYGRNLLHVSLQQPITSQSYQYHPLFLHISPYICSNLFMASRYWTTLSTRASPVGPDTNTPRLLVLVNINTRRALLGMRDAKEVCPPKDPMTTGHQTCEGTDIFVIHLSWWYWHFPVLRCQGSALRPQMAAPSQLPGAYQHCLQALWSGASYFHPTSWPLLSSDSSQATGQTHEE